MKRKASKKSIDSLTDATPRPIVGFVNQESGDISLKDYCEQLQKSEFNNDEGLRLLVDHYKEAINQYETAALCSLFEIASRATEGEDPYISREFYTTLQNAMKGELEAVQRLVRLNPETIYLPFVAEVLVKLLNEYKHTPNLKSTNLKEQWGLFLCSRAGNSNPYPEDVIESVLSIAKGESCNLTEAKEKAVNILGMTDRTLQKKRAKLKLKPGRPKKQK